MNNNVPVLKEKYRSKWIDHYDETLWSNFSKFPFPVPSNEGSEPQHFIHQLMFHSMFNYFNDQHEKQKVLEARLADAEKKLAQHNDSQILSRESSSGISSLESLKKATTPPKGDAASANDDKIAPPLQTSPDHEATSSTTTNIDRKGIDEESDESQSSPSLLDQNLFQRPTLVPNHQLKENKLATTLTKSRTVKKVAAPFASNNYTKSGWIRPGEVKLRPTNRKSSSASVKSNLILADSLAAVQSKDAENPVLPMEVVARNKYNNTSNPRRTLPGHKRKSDELFSNSSSDVGHSVSSSRDQSVKIKVEGGDCEELNFIDYKVDDDDDSVDAEQEEPSHPVFAVKEEPREASQNYDELPDISQTNTSVSTTKTFDDAQLGENTLKMIQSFDQLPRSRSNKTVPTYKFKPDKPVRKKEERAKLPAFVCDMCREYYEAQDLTPDEVQKLVQRCSKHRAQYEARAFTPPDYWRTDFPTTEECIEKGYLNIEERDPNIDPKIRNRI